jgi:hypothetical protein
MRIELAIGREEIAFVERLEQELLPSGAADFLAETE